MTLKSEKTSQLWWPYAFSTWEVEAGGLEFKGQSQLYS